jgi:hypothetical protein
MTGLTTVQARTALSPEWDRGSDADFADLICSDDEWVRAEFDALVRASWGPPVPPAPPAPPATGPYADPPGAGPAGRRCRAPDDIGPENAQPP